MNNLEALKDVAQIVYYLALSISGPLALLGYLHAKRAEQREREHKAYDELDKKFLEYQKLALEHDLDLLDLPDASAYLAGDRLRRKHELVTATCGFALFQRAYLTFHDQADDFKARQWEGWDQLLSSFLARPSVQDAWQIGRLHFDRSFQAHVDERLAAHLEEIGAAPAEVYAFRKTGLLVCVRNEHWMTPENLALWKSALAEHEQGWAA